MSKKKVIRAEDINEDTDIHEFAMFCKEYTDCLKNPKTEAERLRNEIMGDEKTDDEWLKLQSKVQEFLKSTSDKDKEVLRGYPEALCMICSAIKNSKKTE